MTLFFYAKFVRENKNILVFKRIFLIKTGSPLNRVGYTLLSWLACINH